MHANNEIRPILTSLAMSIRFKTLIVTNGVVEGNHRQVTRHVGASSGSGIECHPLASVEGCTESSPAIILSPTGFRGSREPRIGTHGAFPVTVSSRDLLSSLIKCLMNARLGNILIVDGHGVRWHLDGTDRIDITLVA